MRWALTAGCVGALACTPVDGTSRRPTPSTTSDDPRGTAHATHQVFPGVPTTTTSELPPEVCAPQEPLVECAVVAPASTSPGPVVSTDQVAFARFDGWVHDYLLGWGLASIGDPDGDGLAGIAAGATGWGDTLLFDSTDTTQARSMIQADATVVGSGLGRHVALGTSLGEGGEDVVVSASDWPTAGLWGVPLPTLPGDQFLPAAAAFGVSGSADIYTGVSSEDLNGDGLGDLVVTASYSYGSGGGVHIGFGPIPDGESDLDWVTDVTLLPHGLDSSGVLIPLFTDGPAAIPDIDGDGVDDAIVATPGFDFWGRDYWTSFASTGAAYLYTGIQSMSGDQGAGTESGVIVGTCDSQLDGERSVVGDVTGDGTPDLAEGARYFDLPTRSTPGAVFIMSLPCLGTVQGTTDITNVSTAIIVGSNPGDGLIKSTGLGDLNGDGIDDLALGAPNAGGRGSVYIFLGPVRGTIDAADADLVIEGQGEDAWFGYSLAGIDDYDGDGVPDLAVGAPKSDWLYAGFWPDSGSVYVFSGQTLLDAM